jgi:hypothetical protein
MPAHSRPKDGVASLAYVAGIHVFLERSKQDVDGRTKSGHDVAGLSIDGAARSLMRPLATDQSQTQIRRTNGP